MKISITLPNYNHGHYIRDNLDGLLAQTYENWELHVVDDGSTDDSAQIIADYAARDARIKPIYLPQNQGAEAALDCGIQTADGELLYCTAADDYICNPHFFEMAVNAFQNTTAAVFSGDLEVHNIPSDKKSVIKRFVTEGFLNSHESMEAFLKHDLPVHGHSAIMNRQMVLDLGDVSELKSHIDGFWIAALAIQRGSFYAPKTVVTSRSGIENYSNISLNKQFSGYALCEKRIKKNISDDMKKNASWEKWRRDLIGNYVERVIQFEQIVLDRMNQLIDSIPPQNIDSLGQHIIQILILLKNSHDIAQADAHDLTNRAFEIFNDIAGPLE